MGDDGGSLLLPNWPWSGGDSVLEVMSFSSYVEGTVDPGTFRVGNKPFKKLFNSLIESMNFYST